MELTVRVTECWILLVRDRAHNVQFIVTLPEDGESWLASTRGFG